MEGRFFTSTSKRVSAIAFVLDLSGLVIDDTHHPRFEAVHPVDIAHELEAFERPPFLQLQPPDLKSVYLLFPHQFNVLFQCFQDILVYDVLQHQVTSRHLFGIELPADERADFRPDDAVLFSDQPVNVFARDFLQRFGNIGLNIFPVHIEPGIEGDAAEIQGVHRVVVHGADHAGIH